MRLALSIVAPLVLIAILYLGFGLFAPGWSQRYGGPASVASFLAVYLTYIYVVLTGEMVRQMVKSQQEERRPFVVIELDLDGGYGWLLIHNIGRRPAIKLTIKFEPQLVSSWGQKPRPIPLLEHTIAFLPPGRLIRLNLGLRQQVLKANSQDSYQATLSYSWVGRRSEVTETTIVDMKAQRLTGEWFKHDLEDIYGSLEGIRKQLERLNPQSR